MTNKFLKIFGLPIIALIAFIPATKTSFAQSANQESGNFYISKVLAKEVDAESLDLNARKKVLIEILETSQSEIEGLKNKLVGLNLDNNWQKIRGRILDELSRSQAYYQFYENKINEGNINLEEIKQLAADLKDWREKNYTQKLLEATNMILIFKDEGLLKVARERIDKISADIKKLDKQNIIKTDVLKIYLSEADKNLTGADDSKNKAKDLFFKTITEQITTLPEQQLTVLTPENAKTGENQSSEKTGEPAKKSLSPEEIQNSVRDFIKESIKDLRSTYENFLQMNDKIKEYIP